MKNPLKLVIIILSSILAVTAAGTIFSIATRHKHEHTFGEWNFYTVGNLYCEQRLFYRICSTCGEFGWKKGSSQDHDWEITTTSPTCLNQGYDTKTCTICGKVENENFVEPKEHTPSDWIIDKNASTKEDGIKHKECILCHTVLQTEILPKTVSQGLLYAVNPDNKSCTITGIGNCLDTEVGIPSEIDGYIVTAIGESAFYGCGSLTSVQLGNSITSIGSYVFCGCSSLTSVVIGNGVTSIGYESFSGCSSLTSISIPDSVTSIDSWAFSGCSSLTSVVIGDSVTEIGSYAFFGCSSLTSITFKDTSTWYRTTSPSDWENKTGGIQTSVRNSSINDTYFNSTYYNYYWYKL